jgi:hypothetical protein
VGRRRGAMKEHLKPAGRRSRRFRSHSVMAGGSAKLLVADALDAD